jgi:hypothetical protein
MNTKTKTPRTAYAHFLKDKDVRAALKATLSDQSAAAVSKAMAQKWGTMDPTARKPYVDLNLKEKEAYQQAVVSVAVKKAKGKQAKRKRARSAYTLYSMDPKVRDAVKAANPDASFGDLSKVISAQWKALSPEAKAPYEETSNAEKAKVAEQKAAIAATTGTTSTGKTKRARSAYTLYSMDPAVREAAKKAHPDADFGGLSKVISVQWKALSAEAKAPYEEQSNAEKAVVAEAKAKNAPKKRRAKTAYLCFSTDSKQREAAKKALGGDPKVTEIAKHLGAQWKKMTAEQKKPYEEQSAAEKAKLKAEQEAEESGSE